MTSIEWKGRGTLPGRAAFAVGALLVFAPGPAPAQTVIDADATPGGCVQICEDVPYCKDLHIDLKAGRCTLTLDDAGARKAGLLKTCPEGETEQIEIGSTDRFVLKSSCVMRR